MEVPFAYLLGVDPVVGWPEDDEEVLDDDGAVGPVKEVAELFKSDPYAQEPLTLISRLVMIPAFN